MMRMWWLVAALLLAGCASLDGRSLVPGKASSAEVKELMGAPALELKRPNGDTQFYYTHYPYGRLTFVATIGPDDRLRGIEQRLTPLYIAKVAVGMREEDVRELFGPPYKITRLPRQQRNVWEYPWRIMRQGTAHPVGAVLRRRCGARSHRDARLRGRADSQRSWPPSAP